ncbi:YslB family protein [Oceanobacillus saliphilus]|uniref:YslB family protein n=1 Tax=Oceanobacillus saliphilus TaxID=2925834 RepID=UPI00201DA282|nr:YslB family protein [Oceanobacillus saliphilus]
MSKKHQGLELSHLEELNTTGAGYDILRYVTLPELLGQEKNTLLYFMGKSLARKFDFNTIEDIYHLFDKLGWGKLELVKRKRKELIFHLLSDSIVLRLKAPIDTEFRMESGFLSEAVQSVEGIECECVEEINHRINQIEFSVVFTD